MPIHVYGCNSCGAILELKEGFNVRTDLDCPQCGSTENLTCIPQTYTFRMDKEK